MAGGVWVTQNKLRAGTYINFVAAGKTQSVLSTRGIVTLPMDLNWGSDGAMIEVSSEELAIGKSLAKIGLTSQDAGASQIREALRNCVKALVYRLNGGGVKAQTVTNNLTVVAKYSGTLGNALSVSIVATGNNYEVTTMLDNQVKDRQTVAIAESLIANDWVTFSGTGDLVPAVNSVLAGGTNGAGGAGAYTDYFELAKTYTWDTMAAPGDDTINTSVTALITEMRENMGKKVQAVLKDAAGADYEGIISVTGLQNQ